MTMHRTAMRLDSIDTTSPEWALMWGALATMPMNRDNADPCACESAETGEVWQYMGTVYDEWNRTRHHQFRHRSHPAHAGARVYVNIHVSNDRDGTMIPVIASIRQYDNAPVPLARLIEGRTP